MLGAKDSTSGLQAPGTRKGAARPQAWLLNGQVQAGCKVPDLILQCRLGSIPEGDAKNEREQTVGLAPRGHHRSGTWLQPPGHPEEPVEKSQWSPKASHRPWRDVMPVPCGLVSSETQSLGREWEMLPPQQCGSLLRTDTQTHRQKSADRETQTHTEAQIHIEMQTLAETRSQACVSSWALTNTLPWPPHPRFSP